MRTPFTERPQSAAVLGSSPIGTPVGSQKRQQQKTLDSFFRLGPAPATSTPSKPPQAQDEETDKENQLNQADSTEPLPSSILKANETLLAAEIAAPLPEASERTPPSRPSRKALVVIPSNSSGSKVQPAPTESMQDIHKEEEKVLNEDQPNEVMLSQSGGAQERTGDVNQSMEIDVVAHLELQTEMAPPQTPVQMAVKRSSHTPANTYSPMDSPIVVHLKGTLVEVNNGRVYFEDKTVDLSQDESTQSLVKAFHEHVRHAGKVPEIFPLQFYPLLALLVQASDLTLPALAAKVSHVLCIQPSTASGLDEGSSPVQMDQMKPFLLSITNAIKAIALRENYGVRGLTSAPQAAVWRWEVQDLSIFSESIRAGVVERRERRIAARAELEMLLRDYSAADRASIFVCRKRKKLGDEASSSSNSKMLKRLEREMKDADREVVKLQKLREKEEREAEKLLEKEAKENARRAEKEAKEEKKRLEREAKEEQKKIEKEAKDEARRNKEEQKRQVQDQKDQERLKKEEEMSRSQRRLDLFIIKSSKQDVQSDVVEGNEFDSSFPQFHVKAYVELAPIHRFDPSKILNKFDECAISLDHYLSGWKLKRRDQAWPLGRVPLELCTDLRTTRVKLLGFHENYRPAFYGTWSPSSNAFGPRRPFGRDTKVLDYDVDSEEEWEEEEGDECLSEEEDETENLGDGSEFDGYGENDDEEDGWLVPHGYLSDDEGVEEENDAETSKDATDKEKRAKPKEYKRKAIVNQIPILIGPFWYKGEPDSRLEPLIVRFFSDTETVIRPNEEEIVEDDETPKTPAASRIRRPFPEEHLPKLIELMDGANKGVDRIVEDFRKLFGEDSVSKKQLIAKIKEIGSKEKVNGKLIWVIRPEGLSQTPVRQSTSTAENTKDEPEILEPQKSIESKMEKEMYAEQELKDVEMVNNKEMSQEVDISPEPEEELEDGL